MKQRVLRFSIVLSIVLLAAVGFGFTKAPVVSGQNVGWTRDGSSWYYYDNAGNKTTGWQKIGDNWYYFDSKGVMQTGWQEIGGKSYYFNSSGVMLTGSFTDNYGDPCYCNSDGTAYVGWRGQYFYNGWRLHDTSFLQDNGTILFFDSNGKQIKTGGWHAISDGDYFYLESGGKSFSGWVDGVYLIQDGWMARDGMFETEIGWIYFDTKGKAQKPDSGWQKLNGVWYYFDNDATGYTGWVDNGTYYVENGCIARNGSYWTDTGCFYFDANGKWQALSGWQKIDDEWYYFNSDGTAYDGWLDNTYFIASGRMCCDGVCWTDSGYYCFAHDGKVKKLTGWQKLNGEWYYYKNDGTPYEGWLSGKYYISGGWMVYDTAWLTDTGYRVFDKNGCYVKTTGWYQDAGYGWLYFKSNGEPYDGWLEGKYYIDNGRMLCNEWGYADGEMRLFDVEGKIVTGWRKFAGEWCYLKSDGTVYDGWLDGTYYFVSSRMQYGGVCYTDDGYRVFDDNGKYVKKTGWYHDDGYGWMYFKSNGDPYDGWMDSYYIDHGIMCCGGAWYTDTGIRVFDDSGKVVKKTGWYKDENYGWLYFKSNGDPYNGWLEGTYYISDGLMCAGGVFYTDDGYRLFGTDGKLIKKTGWYKAEYYGWLYFDSDGSAHEGWLNNTYYFSDGIMCCDGWHWTDRGECLFGKDGKVLKGWQKYYNEWYYLNSDGTAYSGWLDNTYYISYGRMAYSDACYTDDGIRVFGADGKVVKTTGWYKSASYGWLYFDSSGKPYNGWLDSVYYINSGIMCCGDAYYTDSGICVFGDDGKVVKTTGWYKSEFYGWMYFDSSGKPYSGWLDGVYYIGNGVMYTGLYWTDKGYCLFGEDGKCLSGWQKYYDAWYYCGANGKVSVEWQKIGGVWYYFDTQGAMQTGWQQIGGKWYYFNSKGVMQTGWQKINEKWYWFDTSGVMFANGSKTIGSKTYYFNSSGVCQNP